MKIITKKETAVIINLVYNELNAYNTERAEESFDCQTYSWAIYEVGAYQGLIENNKGLGGVVASLVKKGLAWSDGLSSKDACTGLTDEGYKLFNELFPTTQDVDNYYESETGVVQRPVINANDLQDILDDEMESRKTDPVKNAITSIVAMIIASR